jgi:hypothetical protein
MLTQLYYKALGIKSVRSLRTTIVDVQNINYNKHNKNKYMKIFMDKQSLFWMTWLPIAFPQESGVFAIIVSDTEEMFVLDYGSVLCVQRKGRPLT